MTHQEKQECRQKILRKLRTIKKEAYSGVTCVEYDAINVLINFMECIYKEEKRKEEEWKKL